MKEYKIYYTVKANGSMWHEFMVVEAEDMKEAKRKVKVCSVNHYQHHPFQMETEKSSYTKKFRIGKATERKYIG